MRFDHQAKHAFVIACLALALSGLGFRGAVRYLNIYLNKEPIELREHFATIPRVLDDWRAVGSDAQFDSAMIETLGTDTYLDRTYARDVETGSEQISFHIAYYTGMIDTVPHVPDRCMVAGGFNPVTLTRMLDLKLDTSSWRVDPEHINRKSGEPYRMVTYPHRITGRPVVARMPVGDFAIRTTEFQHQGLPNSRVFAGFFFVANGHVTANPLDVRWLAFDKTDKYAYYCKIQFTVIGDRQFDEAAFVERVSALVDEVLPEIMRCLPDWAEVEARSNNAPGSSQSTTARASEEER